MSQALTNSRIRPALLDSSFSKEFPEFAAAAKALVSSSKATGTCCGSSAATQEVEALGYAMQVVATLSDAKLKAVLRRLGLRGAVKVYRQADGKKVRREFDAGS